MMDASIMAAALLSNGGGVGQQQHPGVGGVAWARPEQYREEEKADIPSEVSQTFLSPPFSSNVNCKWTVYRQLVVYAVITCRQAF